VLEKVCSVMCLDLGVAALEIVERCSGSLFVFLGNGIAFMRV